ncbi:DUF2637 domain-containing protein [Actinomadura sp. WMMA1423]|uniref:DUF2637 domain-containing protein n=1 Tax=Actinomadura sp. WMMA1423 TaxID=2591108 RepID=UPI0011466A5B|nr:DUF2637 domain-containing protein [Actinomadura sp. WMMA1423]
MTTSAAADLDPTCPVPPRPGPAVDVEAPRPDPAPSLPASTAPPVEATPTARLDPSAPDPTRPAPASGGSVPDRGEPQRRRARRSRPDPDDQRDWVVDLGMAVGGVAAIVASFTFLRGLAYDTGWGRLDWLLPVDLDTVVITATRVWQSRHTRSRRVRKFAAQIAVGAIVLSLAGNACYHAIHADAWDPGEHMWLLVVLVSSIPPVSIALISHLAVLRGRDREFAAEEAKDAAAPDPAPTAPAYPGSVGPTEADPPRPAPTVDTPSDHVPDRSDQAAPTDPTPTIPDPTGVPAPPPAPAESTAPHSNSTGRPAAKAPNPDPTERKRPAPAPTGMGENDPLLTEARTFAAEHFERTGRKIGAEPLATHFAIGTKRSRLLRDAVHGIREVEPKDESGGDS